MKKTLKRILAVILCTAVVCPASILQTSADITEEPLYEWRGESKYKHITLITCTDFSQNYEDTIWGAMDDSGKFGVIDSAENIIYPFELDYMPIIIKSPSYLCATKDGKKGIIDVGGKIIVPFELDNMPSNLSPNGFLLRKGDKYACCHSGTAFITEYIYDSVEEYRIYNHEHRYNETALYLTEVNGKKGFLDLSCKTISEPIYDSISTLSSTDKLLLTEIENKYGVMDLSGNVLINNNYEEIEYMGTDHFKVRLNGKYAIADRKNNILIPFLYDEIYWHSDGLNNSYGYYDVSVDGKYGIIDGNGNIVIPIEYDYLSSMHETQYLSANKDGKTYVIDYSENIITAFDRQFDYAVYSTDNYYFLIVGEMVGIGDKNGNVLMDVIYEDGSITMEGESTVILFEDGNNSTVIVDIIDLTTMKSVETMPPIVFMPEFSITINDYVIENRRALYPCIVYKDITYFPMTYSDSRALGLIADWTAEGGLVIEKTGTEPYAPTFEQGTAANVSGRQTASVVDSKVTVNGKAIDNASEEYPLLLFRDVTYFPLTWRFAVEEFGWEYSFTPEKGLVITGK